MQPLDRKLRNKLESTVKEARDVAEAAASAATEQFGVGVRAAYPHLSDEEKELRRKLRIHGKQLGDRRDSKSTNPTVGEQETTCLVEEVAYEHWHRMLFARFLAENNLLMYPDETDPVPVTLEECEDLAADEGAANGWELASRFAARMLPQIFRPDSPVFELTLPPEHQHKLERLLADLPPEVFHASDALGWVYQFWQAKRKDQVNASEVKIGARELPAVTQLFTEPYMVAFLLDNTLGAWWAGKRLTEGDLASAKSEEELRQKASLPDVPLEYLRFVQGEDGKGGPWRPAAGTFGGWPEKLSELKVLDPCCGSGHFLVAALHMLVPMRMEMDGLSPRDAIASVLRDNVHGVEVDKRCVELAAFGLATASWRYPGTGGYRVLPELNVACSGVAISASKHEWLGIGHGQQSLKFYLEQLYDLFKNAPILGSLVNPRRVLEENSIIAVDFNSLQPLLSEALRREGDTETIERTFAAQHIAHAANLLSGTYVLVATNVPYLGRRKQDTSLQSYCSRQHPAAKLDLAACIMERCHDLCEDGGTSAIVTLQNSLFLSTYEDFRRKWLKQATWNLVSRLGPKGFETPMYDFGVALLVLTRGRPHASQAFSGIDVGHAKSPSAKNSELRRASVSTVPQSRQLKNPDAAIVFDVASADSFLVEFADSYQGSGLADITRYRHLFWELAGFDSAWAPHQSSPSGDAPFSGMHFAVLWQDGQGSLAKEPSVTIRGRKAWGHQGVACAWLGRLPSSLYCGALYDNSAAAIIPKDRSMLGPIWCYMSSPDYHTEVRKINQKTQVANATLVKVPFDVDHWTRVAGKRYPNGLPRPYSNDPTEWLFHGHPCEAVMWDDNNKEVLVGQQRTNATVLHVAVSRLLGYRWPAELNEEMCLSDRARELVKRCDELLPLADKDGIVCIPAVRGEASAADRLHNLLAKAYGDAWNTDKLNELLKQADHGGKTLETWLRDKFFVQHCQIFGQRPFIWHIWDGLRDGFSVLVNYHKLDHKNLETLIYTYLGDWISRQKRDRDSGADGAEEKLDAAEALKKRLELILEGETPCDIFVRWKPIEEQPVGWQPDLNDGVRLNIRPFVSVPDVKKKGAGVLREKLRIHWKKDRGKDVKSAPWYDLGPKYGGKKADRINDHHLTLDEKREARELAEETV